MIVEVEMQGQSSIQLRVNKEIRSIELTDILYIQSLGNYLKIFTAEGFFLTMMTMSQIEDQLQKNDFIRIHRSFLTNINRITSMDDLHIAVGGKIIPIGKTYKQYVHYLLKNRKF